MGKCVEAKITLWVRHNLTDDADLESIEKKAQEGQNILDVVEEDGYFVSSEYLFDTEDMVQNINGNDIYEIWDNDQLIYQSH